jgi:hypothetical protein
MSGVSVKVAREGYDVNKADPKNLAFSSDYFLPKIFRVKRASSNSSVAHGLSYSPRTIFMREVTSSPLKVGHTVAGLQSQDVSTVDDTNINFRRMTNYSDFEVTPYSTTTDSAVIALCTIDPLATPGTASTPVEMTQPVFKAGGSASDPDYDRQIHTLYDTLKTNTSGTLTLNVSSWTPNAGDKYDVTTATYTHGLGYVPLFAPFVPCQISLSAYYYWYWAWHKRFEWATSTEYVIDDYVTDSFGTPTYKCIKYHTSSSSSRPGVGANWTTYWVSFTSTNIPSTISVNGLEDIKYTYGGTSNLDDEHLEVYVNTTQLVIKLHRVSGDPGYPTFPARTITMDYTIFENKLNEDHNLLD